MLWLIKVKDFVWRRLNHLSIIYVDRLLVTCETVYRLLLSMWDNFLSWATTLAAEKGSKNGVPPFLYRIERM